MSAGTHTLKAYHNNSDKNQTQPDIEVRIDGNVAATGVKFTSAARSLSLYHLDIETERTESVVAADHGTHRVLHPAIVEVPLAPG